MLEKFQKQITENMPFLTGKKLLLAVSGGIDSMVMADLFRKQNFEIALAHCNFQLRGIASFEDEEFVKAYAGQHQIPLFSTHFDTKAFADDYKLSIQVAARELRYNWFYEIADAENFDYILTAHHADDNLETFLINFSRGTGIEGLTGIPMVNDKVIRPLLAFSRNEIEHYAKDNHVEWREDSSNASDAYLRNSIRHALVPVLKELNPEILAAFQKTQDYLQQTAIMAEDAAIMVYQQVAKTENDTVYFDLKKLMQLPNYRSYLYQWLREYGFTAWQDIYSLTESQSGKQVFAPQFRLLKDRGKLILAPLAPDTERASFWIAETDTDVKIPINLSFSKVLHIRNTDARTIFVDGDKLAFPLQLRKWEEGDVFEPFGMDGQSKKVSKFFKDEKIPLTQKASSWLLCSGNRIVWIVGMRADNRFRVTQQTTYILQIALL